jgi:DNA-binding transcriptional ArsR family regulator
MLRVHFTADDLLRVTMAETPAPLMELELALAMLQQPVIDPLFQRWQRRTQQMLPRIVRPLLELIPPSGKGPLFLDPISRDLDDGLHLVRSSTPARVLTDLQRLPANGRVQTPWIKHLAEQDPDAWRTLDDAVRAGFMSLLTPLWHRITLSFRAEQAWRAQVLAQEGMGSTLAGLAKGIAWQESTLHIDSPENRDIVLAGRGIILLPSVLWSGYPLVADYPQGTPVMVYPAVTPLPLLDEPSATDPVAALLGRTRAAILDLLTRQRTTTEVATELGISKSSASEHAKALRHARLIVSQREGQAIWHTCTPLGLGLLAGRPTISG